MSARPRYLTALAAAFLSRAQAHACAWLVFALMVVSASPTANAQTAETSTYYGPVRLTQPTERGESTTDTGTTTTQTIPADPQRRLRTMEPERTGLDRRAIDGFEEAALFDFEPRTRYRYGEFELFVRRLAAPADIRRFGAELVTLAQPHLQAPIPGQTQDALEQTPPIPADYLIKVGDEVLVTLWGSVVADLRLVVDRGGRITIPRVGPVLVAGTRYADLQDVISKRVELVFRNFQLSASLGRLRGVRVFVTGFAERPGAYNVASLSTLVQALMRAGGPSAAGSFRDIQLRRDGRVVAAFDLYRFLIDGDRSADQPVQADDVIHVGPVGPQVALIGSVNRPAIFELREGDTVQDVLRMAAGFTAVADRSRLAVERLDDRATVRIEQLNLPADARATLASGDVLRAFSAVAATLPVERQNKRVRVEGEVARPGEYVLPPASTIGDAIRAAGGLTSAAFIFGTEFTRESVRQTQQINYERALRDLEVEYARSTSTRRVTSAEEAAGVSARDTASARLIERLRAVRPTGRVVLQIPPDATELPELALEDGDQIRIPPRSTTVGVFGSVFNAGSFLFSPDRQVEDYLRLAGGPTRGAEPRSTFVIRANGSVVSGLANTTWFSSGTGLRGVRAEPGDTIFVPEELDKTTFVQSAKDWTQILAQFALGVAALNSIK